MTLLKGYFFNYNKYFAYLKNFFKDRAIVVREPNGRLRTALPEEHFRMNRIFFDKPDRPVREPPLFHLHSYSDGKIVCGDILLVLKYFYRKIYLK